MSMHSQAIEVIYKINFAIVNNRLWLSFYSMVLRAIL